MSFVWGKSRKPAHGSATQVTEINTLDQIIRKVIDLSRTHIPHSGHLMNDSLERCEIERCSVSEPLNAAVNDDVWKESRHDDITSLHNLFIMIQSLYRGFSELNPYVQICKNIYLSIEPSTLLPQLLPLRL